MRILKGVIIIVAIAIMLAMALQARSQSREESNKIIDVVIEKARQVSLNSSQVKWDSLRVVMHASSKDATSILGLKTSFEIMLGALNDREGVFYNPTTNTAITSSHLDGRIEEPHRINTPFHYTTLDNGVRYLRIASLDNQKNLDLQAKEIRDAIDSLSNGDAMQWIVDLRYATGGDMKPLFAGVSQILAEGLAFTEVDNKNNIVSMYTVHNGNFYIDQVPVIRFPLSEFDSKNAKIAVLTSRYTNGAAELLAIALRGKKNTKVFGESTAGNVLGMKSIAISKDLAMKLASTFYVDRKGVEHKHAIDADVKIEFTEVMDINNDHGIAEAMLWLNDLPEPLVRIGMN